MSPALRLGSLLVLCTVACVRIPASIKQEFRAAEPDERSNYQAGLRGTAPPVDASDPWSRYQSSRSPDSRGSAPQSGAPGAPAGSELDAGASSTPPATSTSTPIPPPSPTPGVTDGGMP